MNIREWIADNIGYRFAGCLYANAQGEGNLKYINPDDYIHPSTDGIDLISKTIAEFIYTNSIFPQ